MYIAISKKKIYKNVKRKEIAEEKRKKGGGGGGGVSKTVVHRKNITIDIKIV